ncbi:MAG TPA: FAD-binding oxidoreductase [Candidatus Methylomirabilis sp.]|nr:FAD-binding oxidoreductase [Candidatus Methylomirabilis sp.]
MTADLLTARLEGIVGAEHVLPEERCAQYAVDGKVPAAAAFPATVEELSEVMRLASSERLSVVPWGNGTKTSLGGIPERVDLLVGLARFNRVIEHEPADLTATIQGGALLREVQACLGQRGQFLPLDPPLAARATIGGILAANASGPRRLLYGAARDLLIGIRVVHADGTTTTGGAKVVKNVSGYDMPKLYIGSLGTLGIIVEATFRIYPLPAVERTWVTSFPHGEGLSSAVAEILAAPIVPGSLEVLSSAAAQLVATQAGLSLPQGHVALASSVGSVAEAVDAQIAQIKKISERSGAEAGFLLEGDAQARFWTAISNFAPRDRDGGVGVALKASVVLRKVLDTVRRSEEIARSVGLQSLAIGEAGSGIVRLHWTVDGGEPGVTVEVMAKAIEALRDSIVRHGGSLVVVSAPAAVKAAVDVWGSVGSALALMRELKQQFDPHRILNPGRFVGGI